MFILEELNYLMFWSLQKRECTINILNITTCIYFKTHDFDCSNDINSCVLHRSIWTYLIPVDMIFTQGHIYIFNISVLTFFCISSNCAILSFVLRCQLKREIIQHGKELSYFNKQHENWCMLMVLEILVAECLVQHVEQFILIVLSYN